MKKSMKLLSVFLILLFVGMNAAYAGLVNYERRNRYLKQSAQVQAGETVVEGEETDLPLWMKVIPRVKNRTERKYDVNRDGKLQTAEVKIFLRDVIEIIEAKGGHTINSDILKEYDKNRDGVISRFELKEVVRDAGY